MTPKDSLNSLDPDNPNFDIETWAEQQWDNWPDIETDLQFGFALINKEANGEFLYCIAYFSYWKFKVDITNTTGPIGGQYRRYKAELTISLDPDGDGQ